MGIPLPGTPRREHHEEENPEAAFEPRDSAEPGRSPAPRGGGRRHTNVPHGHVPVHDSGLFGQSKLPVPLYQLPVRHSLLIGGERRSAPRLPGCPGSPRSSRGALRSLPECLKSVSECPRSPPECLRSFQESARMSQECPKTVPERFRTLLESSRMIPERSKILGRDSEMSSRLLQTSLERLTGSVEPLAWALHSPEGRTKAFEAKTWRSRHAW